jgi:hypothetical protein
LFQRSEQVMARKLVLSSLAAFSLAFSPLLSPAPAAAIPPRCVDTGPNTTQCSTNGSTAIVTSPPRNQFANFGPWFGGGWGWGGGLVIGIG